MHNCPSCSCSCAAACHGTTVVLLLGVLGHATVALECVAHCHMSCCGHAVVCCDVVLLRRVTHYHVLNAGACCAAMLRGMRCVTRYCAVVAVRLAMQHCVLCHVSHAGMSHVAVCHVWCPGA